MQGSVMVQTVLTAPTERRRSTPLVWSAIAVAVFAVWVGTSLGGETVTSYVDDLATLLAASTAAASCFVTSRRHTGRTRVFWRLLAAALSAWTFAEAAWAVYDLALGGEVPVPSYADIGYLGAIPLVIAALLVHRGDHDNRRARLRATIDASILATALLFLSWTFILNQVWSSSELTSASGLVTFAYPAGDVLIVFLLIRALPSLEGSDRSAFGWILVGLMAMSLADSGYTYLTAVRGYETGNLIDVGWLVGYLGIAIGAWHGRQPQRSSARAPSPVAQTATLLTPFLPLMLALGALTVKAQLGTPIDRTSLVLAFVLTGSVLVRRAFSVVAPSSSVGGVS
jgi:diguanylate cyclase